MIPKINSAHGSDTRNIINRVIEVLNQQGKTIQDLVAEGQLTEEQYAELISVINGLVKSGEINRGDLSSQLRREVDEISKKINRGEVNKSDLSKELSLILDGKINKGSVSVSDIDKNLGKFDSTFFASEFIEQLNKGIVDTTNVLPKSITPVEIQRDGVTSEHIDFVSKTRNLFDLSRIIEGKALTQTGELSDATSSSTTDYYIEVSPDTSYHKNKEGSVLEFDKDKKIVNYHHYVTPAGSFVTDSKTRFVKLSMTTTDIHEYQLELGQTETDYTPYGRLIDNSMINITGSQIQNETVSIDKLSGFVKSRNMLDKNKMVNAYVNRTNGELIEHPGNRATKEYIAVEENTAYNFQPLSVGTNIAFYNNDKNFISSFRIDDSSSNGNISTPSGTAFMRLSYIRQNDSVAQLEIGTEPTEYEPYYMYHPGIVSPMENSGGGEETGVTKPNLLEVLNPYDIRFSFPIKNNQMASFRFANSGTGDDFMKGRESSILNNNLNKLFDLTHEASNKEFALSVSDGTQDSDWFPEHNGVSTAHEGTIGFRKLVADGNNIDISKASNIPIKFNTAVLTQKMEFSLPYDTTPRAILTFVVTIEDGECKETIRVEWKKDTTVHSGYFFMTPMHTPDFVDGLLTSEFEYAESQPDATEQPNTPLDKLHADKFYFTSNRTDKTDILFTTEIIRTSEEVKSLFWQHRRGEIEKLYPQQFKNTSRQTGDIDYAEGVYKIETVPNANEVYRLN